MLYPYNLPLHIPHVALNQIKYLSEAIRSGRLSSYGFFSQKCEDYFKDIFNSSDCFLTHSCTAALEMTALLLELEKDDEVIVPSFTFVSTANAFALRSCKIRWADSQKFHPNTSIAEIEPLINSKTKAIVVVHYAGFAVDLDPILALCRKYHLALIEDAAQALNGFYKGQRLGSLGDFSTFSFHDTKPISCGEGGLLVVNNKKYSDKARQILEKGTDRQAFLMGHTPLYQWQALGSSYAASQLQASCLLAQLEELEFVFDKRKMLWNKYVELFNSEGSFSHFKLPALSEFTTYNTSVFYIELLSKEHRDNCIQYLNKFGIGASFHYLPLHSSPFGSQYSSEICKNAEYWSSHILRLPMYASMEILDVEFVVRKVLDYFT